MEKRRLGSTNLELSVLSFGASSLGHAFGPVNYRTGISAVKTALDLGITHFDTSPFYGQGVSEVLLGIALSDIRRDHYTISTKLGRYGENIFDFRAERVVESIDASLARLGTDYLDIVFLHDIEFTDLRQALFEALPALQNEQRKGKVRYVGIAGYPIATAVKAVHASEFDVLLNYNHYTLQNRRLVDELLPLLKQHNIGVVNASPFAQRLFTHSTLPDWHPAPESVRRQCGKAVAYIREQGFDPAQLCIQFSTRNPGISTCVVGTGNPNSVRKWVDWLHAPYEQELVAQVEAILQPVLDESWVYGLPENCDGLPAVDAQAANIKPGCV